MTDAARLDQWLWAARFFRTRTLAKEAIEAGHVRHDGERCKVAKDVKPGMMLSVRRGHEELDVIVRGLSIKRGGAPEAQQLYEETADSVARRERRRSEQQAAGPVADSERPSKKGRRLIHRFKRSHSWDA
ncbi:MAG: RNA-binding S4 domain-containing protein [Solimonas sp.]